MVDNELLPLYLSEANERLQRLRKLVTDGASGEDLRVARRELHTLKGASRMIGLVDIADLCHRMEDVLADRGGDVIVAAESIVDQIKSCLNLLAEKNLDTQTETDAGTAQGLSDWVGEISQSTDIPTEDQVVMSRHILDRLSDECARLRVISESAGGAVKRLDRLARLSERAVAGEDPRQVLAQLATQLRRLALDTGRARRRFEELVDRQLDTLLKFQVQPVGPFLRHLSLHIEELAGNLGKAVEVRIEGSDCRIDRRIVEALREALLHLGANAVDHGLETERQRVESGKARRGVIVLRADASHDRFRFEVRDDGGGIDSKRLLDEAVSRGLVSRDVARELDSSAILQLVFRSGFSTRESVGRVSGRGVGLDAVAAAVRRVGGEVWLDSEPGKGTTVTLDLPVARRGERVTLIEAAGFRIALPSAAVRGFEVISSESRGDSAVSTPGSTRTLDLGRLLGGQAGPTRISIELTVSGRRFDLVVDHVFGEEEVFVKTFPEAIGPVTLLEGMALLAGGQAVGVLDVSNLDTIQNDTMVPARPNTQVQDPIRILLVDDSRVTREMVRRMLIKEGFQVMAVDSATSAVNALSEIEFDCLVTDIDMPAMNGLELTRKIRADAWTANLPIILISTAGAPSDRLAGLEAGADAFVVKQRLDRLELSKMVSRLVGRTPA